MLELGLGFGLGLLRLMAGIHGMPDGLMAGIHGMPDGLMAGIGLRLQGPQHLDLDAGLGVACAASPMDAWHERGRDTCHERGRVHAVRVRDRVMLCCECIDPVFRDQRTQARTSKGDGIGIGPRNNQIQIIR